MKIISKKLWKNDHFQNSKINLLSTNSLVFYFLFLKIKFMNTTYVFLCFVVYLLKLFPKLKSIF